MITYQLDLNNLLDGAMFADRYGLDNGHESGNPDFWVTRDSNGNYILCLRDGVTLPDDPPVFEPTPPPPPPPPDSTTTVHA